MASHKFATRVEIGRGKIPLNGVGGKSPCPWHGRRDNPATCQGAPRHRKISIQAVLEAQNDPADAQHVAKQQGISGLRTVADQAQEQGAKCKREIRVSAVATASHRSRLMPITPKDRAVNGWHHQEKVKWTYLLRRRPPSIRSQSGLEDLMSDSTELQIPLKHTGTPQAMPDAIAHFDLRFNAEGDSENHSRIGERETW